jgi:hypothetical protein
VDNVPFIVPLTVLSARRATIVVAGFIELRAVVVYESVSVPDKYKNTPHLTAPSNGLFSLQSYQNEQQFGSLQPNYLFLLHIPSPSPRGSGSKEFAHV